MSEQSILSERDCSGGFLSTSLMKAAVHGDVRLVEVALECTSTNLDAVDAHGRTALTIACQNGHAAVVRALLAAGCDLGVGCSGSQADAIADEHGHADIAEAVRTEARARASLEAAISGCAPCDGATDNGSRAGAADELMAKLLKEAGLPKGSKEAPF